MVAWDGLLWLFTGEGLLAVGTDDDELGGPADVVRDGLADEEHVSVGGHVLEATVRATGATEDP